MSKTTRKVLKVLFSDDEIRKYDKTDQQARETMVSTSKKALLKQYHPDSQPFKKRNLGDLSEKELKQKSQEIVEACVALEEANYPDSSLPAMPGFFGPSDSTPEEAKFWKLYWAYDVLFFSMDSFANQSFRSYWEKVGEQAAQDAYDQLSKMANRDYSKFRSCSRQIGQTLSSCENSDEVKAYIETLTSSFGDTSGNNCKRLRAR